MHKGPLPGGCRCSAALLRRKAVWRPDTGNAGAGLFEAGLEGWTGGQRRRSSQKPAEMPLARALARHLA